MKKKNKEEYWIQIKYCAWYTLDITHANSRITRTTHSFNRCGKLNKWVFIKLAHKIKTITKSHCE